MSAMNGLSFEKWSAPPIAHPEDVITGTPDADILTGTTGDDTIDGAQGADTLTGGAGNDTYIDPDGATIVENAAGGLDRVYAGFNYDLAANLEVLILTGTATEGRGNDLANGLIGNALDNLLAGRAGNDVLIGLGGNDNLLGSEGFDTLNGGDGDDRLNGSEDDDMLVGDAGNDTLIGGVMYAEADTDLQGADTLIGGAGDDTYVNPIGDTIVELPGQGVDTIVTFGSFSIEAMPEIENLTLSGRGPNTARGNAGDNVLTANLQANCTLQGLAGADTLRSGDGADRLEGGVGNDTYINPSYGEVIETSGQGFDRVISDGSFSLATLSYVERLELTGAVPGFLRGNNFANQLVGNSGSNMISGFDGDDTLYGLGGRDTISGGLGRDQIAPGLERDTLVFNAVAESTGAGRDAVSEWIFGFEKLDFTVVPVGIGPSVTSGALNEATFDGDLVNAIGASQLGAGMALLFDPDSGDLNVAGHIYLIVDANGVAGYQAGEDYVVQFTSHYGALTLSDFI